MDQARTCAARSGCLPWLRAPPRLPTPLGSQTLMARTLSEPLRARRPKPSVDRRVVICAWLPIKYVTVAYLPPSAPAADGATLGLRPATEKLG